MNLNLSAIIGAAKATATIGPRRPDFITNAEAVAGALEAAEAPPVRRRGKAKPKHVPTPIVTTPEAPYGIRKDGTPMIKRGRPRKEGALNSHERELKSQKLLKESGGKRSTFNLSAGAVKALAKVVKHHGFKTEREGMEFALLDLEARLARRVPKDIGDAQQFVANTIANL